MEIINGIKFHAIISFDFFSHFLLASLTKASEEGANANKDISSASRKSLLSFALKTFKSHFYSFS